MSKLSKILFVLNLFICSAATAQQAATITDFNSWQVKIQEENSFDEEGLRFLKWSQNIYSVYTRNLIKYVAIQGQFRDPVKQALLNSKIMKVNEDGSFELKIIVSQEKKIRFNIFATDMSGKEYKMQYTLAALHPKNKELPISAWRHSVGAGLTLISFRQRNVIAFDEWAVTVKAGTIYRLVPDQWDLGLSSFFNLAALSTNSPTKLTIQYFGFNAKAAYHVVEAPSSLRINISGGLYFNGSVSSVGFATMFGPQVSPELAYLFSNGNSLFWYGKFAYALGGTHNRFFKDNREVAMGIHYSFPISAENRVSVGVDVSQLSLEEEGHWASTNTYSLSGGISF